MSFFWQYVMDPDFQLDIVDYITRGDADELHWHDYLQIAVCMDGKGKFLFTNKEYTVEKGDVFIIGNFENHVAISTPDETTEFLMILFLPNFIAQPGSRQFDFEYLYPFKYNAKTFRNKLSHEVPQAQSVAELAQTLKTIYNDKQPGRRHMLDAVLRQILAILIGYYKSTYDDYCSLNGRSQLMTQDAMLYINQNFLRNLTLEEVANEVHLSASRFRHVFREVVGIGFKEYITYLRLSECRRLLLTTDLNITEVAFRSGFTNIHQFYKVFYKYVHISPAQYRERFACGNKQLNKSKKDRVVP